MTDEEKLEKIREEIAKWLFTFVRDREDLALNWEQTKGYYLQEADNLLASVEGIVIESDNQNWPQPDNTKSGEFKRGYYQGTLDGIYEKFRRVFKVGIREVVEHVETRKGAEIRDKEAWQAQKKTFSMMQSESLREIERLGQELNLMINCPVKYPANEKNAFACSCGIHFPAYLVRAAQISGDWSTVRKRHSGGTR